MVNPMPRARRIASVLCRSLLLVTFITVLVFWYRSAHSMDEVILTTAGRLIDITSFRGRLGIDTMRGWPNSEKIHMLSASPSPVDGEPEADPPPPYPTPDIHGIGGDSLSWHGLILTRTTFRVGLNADGTAHWTIPGSIDWDYWKSGAHLSGDMPGLSGEVPYWVLASLVGGPLAISAFLWGLPVVKHWRRRRKGLCPACGYDLRASMDRCSECGRRVR